MDNLHEKVQNIQEKQAKDEQIRKRQGHGDPSKKLPTNRNK